MISLGVTKRKGDTMKKAMAVVLVLCASIAHAAVAKSKDSGPFYVYSNKGERASMNFAPSGWMGDYGDIKLNDGSTENPADGKTATRWAYDAKGTQGANWAGAFYQHPPNN